MVTYTPPGWPAGVHPPGSEDFESTAVGWLLDVVPPDYRLHGVLRRYPVALATMARHHSRACVDGARQGYRTARTELAGTLPPHAIDTVLAAYRKEGARLAATARAVGLVERALRGEVFTPAMGDLKPTESPFESQPTVAKPTETRQPEPGTDNPKAGKPKAKAGEPNPGSRPVAARVGAGRAEAPRGEVARGEVARGEVARGEVARGGTKRPARQRKAT
jgi:hypothetical protein